MPPTRPGALELDRSGSHGLPGFLTACFLSGQYSGKDAWLWESSASVHPRRLVAPFPFPTWTNLGELWDCFKNAFAYPGYPI